MNGIQLNEVSCSCKIGRSIDRYELSELNDGFIEMRQDHQTSFRDLATFMNHQILKSAIENASGSVLDDEGGLFGALERKDAVAAIYDAIEGDDVPSDRRVRVRTRLQQAGVDVGSVEDAWITHPTVRRHLQECLEIDTNIEKSFDQDSAKDTIEWAQTRCTAVIVRTFERLQKVNKLKIRNLDVTVSIRATCTECGGTYSPVQIINRGHCDCYESTTT